MTAGWFSLLTFSWLNPLMGLGYARPLEAPDLYKLQEHRSSSIIADKITASFEARVKAADEYNARLASGEVKPSLRQRVIWTLKRNRADREKRWREVDGKKKPSLVYAMNDSVKWWFWSSGLLKVIGDTAQVTSPLVVKVRHLHLFSLQPSLMFCSTQALINFATQSYAAHRLGQPAPPIGKGIGLAFGLFLMQIVGSLCQHHFFYRSTSTGVLLRAGLITAIYSRALRLTSRARSSLPNGKLVNHISTDVSRIDFCCGFFHMFWTAPIQMVICLILLIINLGPSALAGFAFFIFITPMQMTIMKSLFKIRRKTMQWTDKRAKLLQELLGGMKVIKFFAWETPFLKRISGFRMSEMRYVLRGSSVTCSTSDLFIIFFQHSGVRSLLIIRAANTALAMSAPAMASVIAFLIYAASGHTLNPAIIFSSLSLFNLLRMPLMLFRELSSRRLRNICTCSSNCYFA